jgi:hypothetical protein
LPASPLVTLSSDFVEGIIVLGRGTDDSERENSVSGRVEADRTAGVGWPCFAFPRGHAGHSHLAPHDPSCRHRPVWGGPRHAATFGPRRRELDPSHVSAHGSSDSNLRSAHCTCRSASGCSASRKKPLQPATSFLLKTIPHIFLFLSFVELRLGR